MSDVLERLNAALAGRYAVERELGQGGMATVYLALDVRHKRKVALKVMRPELAATLGSERFLREVHTAAGLQHPHILPLHDSGEADGFLYFVMPYIEGESLRTRLTREGELPVGDAVRLLRDVVDALSHAHAQGVVHRDIKPDNVLLSGRHAMVTDFGVAKAVSDSTGARTLTTAGVALGTPTYMSPEQAAADPMVDHRADIYAVGILGYELLTGHPPFTGVSAQQILVAQATRAPQPIRELRPAVPPPLEAVIMRCLAKSPADRWQSADELLAQVEGFMTPTGGTTPIETRPVRALTTPGVRVPRRVVSITAGVALLAVIVVGALLLTRRGAGSSGKPRVVVMPPLNLGPPDQAYLAEGIAEEVNNRLVSLPGIEVIGRTSAERYRQTTLTPQQIGAQLHADYILSLRIGSEGPAAAHRLRVNAELVRARTEAQVWGQSFQAESTSDYFRVQGDIAQQVAQGMGVSLAAGDRSKLDVRPTSNAEAYDLFLRANIELGRGHALADYRDAQALLERAVALDPSFAVAWARLTEAHIEQFWFWGDRSERRRELARAAADRAGALAPDAPETHFARGIFYYHGYLDFPHALDQLRAAVAVNPGEARYYEYMGFVQRRAGQFDAALKSLRRAMELDPEGEQAVSGVAELLDGMGRAAEARPTAERAVALWPDDWLAQVVAVQGRVETGDLADAANAAERAIERLSLPGLLTDRPRELANFARLLRPADVARLLPFPPLGPAMPDTAGYYLARGRIEDLLHRDARASFDSAAAVYERRLRARPDEPWDHCFLGVAYAGLGRRDDAIREGRRAQELLPLTKDAWEGPGLIATLAFTYLRFGQRDAAVAELVRFIAAQPGNRALVRYAPVFAPFRDDPRIKRLIS